MRKDLLNFLLGIFASIIATYITTKYTNDYIYLTAIAICILLFFSLFLKCIYLSCCHISECIALVDSGACGVRQI